MSLIPYAAADLAGSGHMEGIVPILYKDTKWAANKIARGLGKAYKARKARSSRKRKKAYHPVGEPMKLSHVKRDNVFTFGPSLTQTRLLYDNELTAIAGGDGENKRDRQLINAKGIEFTYHVANKLTSPVFVNVAIIAPKHTTDGISGIDFFRSSDGDRGKNFSIALSALELHYLPINTDKYNILRHYRHQLGSQADTAGTYNSDAGRGNWLSRKYYVPINRQLRYDGTLSNTCNTPIFMVYWCDRMDCAPSDPATLDAVQFSFMHTMFFTDVL